MRPSATGTASASTTFTLSGLSARTPHDPCLRFGRCVATPPARLGPGLPATALAGRDFHPQVIFNLPSALPLGVEIGRPPLPSSPVTCSRGIVSLDSSAGKLLRADADEAELAVPGILAVIEERQE